MAGSSLAFCGLNRLDAQMGDFPTYGAWEFQQSGGAKESVYNVYGQMVAIGNNVNNGFAGFTYAEAPGTGPCPAGTGWTCTVENDTGGAGGGASYPSPCYVIEEVSTTTLGQVLKIIDPGGNIYTLNYFAGAGLQLENIYGPLSNGTSGYVWQFPRPTTTQKRCRTPTTCSPTRTQIQTPQRWSTTHKVGSAPRRIRRTTPRRTPTLTTAAGSA